MVKETRRNEIEKVFGIKLVESEKMESAIELWRRMYEDDPIWIEKGVEPIGIPSAVASEIARMATNDLEVTVSGSPLADIMQTSMNKLITQAKEYTEHACAKGAIALKPYYSPVKNTIEITVFQADEFFPTRFDSDDIMGAIFVDQKFEGEYCYTRLERHELFGTTYGIENRVFCKKVMDLTGPDMLGEECTLQEVEDWKDIQPIVVLQNVTTPLFAYFKMPIANNIEPKSPLGVSVYAKAWKRIKRADMQWANICWEYDATQAAIHADEDMFITTRNGELAMEERKKRLYRRLEGFKEQMQIFTPAIRDQSLFNGLNQILRQVEFQCNLSFGTISDPNQVEKTAEEFKASKVRSVSFVTDVQTNFRNSHLKLLDAIRTLAVIYGVCPDGEYEAVFNFDDSLAVSRSETFKELMQLAAAGMIRPEKVTAWYFSIPEEEALKLLPEPFDDTEEEGPEEE